MHVCEEQRGQTRETHNSYINCRLTAYLYFHGHLPAILHPRQVNLADGRCCKRTLLKRLQLVSPVGTQITVQRFLQTDTNKSYFCSSSYSTLYTVVKTCPYLYIYISCIQLWLPVNVKKKKRPLLSFVWLAWSQRSVVHAQRSWPVEGWWKRHLKCRNRWFIPIKS